MIQTLVISLLVFAYGIFIPSSAQAYLLPLIGAGPAIVAILIGVIAALFSALYLVVFNIRRSIKRRMGKESPEDEDEEAPADKNHTPS